MMSGRRLPKILRGILLPSSVLRMLVTIYHTTQHHIPDDHILDHKWTVMYKINATDVQLLKLFKM
jgi:hypothetical protein